MEEEKNCEKDHKGGQPGYASLVVKVQERLSFFLKGCERWMTIREFQTSRQCIEALQEEGWELWATDLSPTALSLEDSNCNSLPVPQKLAIAIGNEAQGVSQELLEAARHSVFPMFGFTESFNLSVTAALVLQTLFRWCPEARGDLDDETTTQLRGKWYDQLSTTSKNTEIFENWKSRGLAGEIPPLDDLRRTDKEPTIPKKIRKRMAEGKAKMDADLKQGKADASES